VTEFHALDKPIPGRRYLDVYRIDKNTQTLESLMPKVAKKEPF